MAHIAVTMTAIGVDAEQCADCERRFARGERMNAVESEAGEPLGWYCDACIAVWRKQAKGETP